MANILTAGNSSNGGTAITTDTSGTLNIVTGSGSGSNAITIDASQAVVMPGTLAVTGAQTIGGNLTVTGTLTASGGVSGSITSGTAVSASGTAVNYTSIPSGVKRITAMFYGLSTNGTSLPIVQLGSGSIQTSGYLGRTNDASTGTIAYSTGFNLSSDGAAANVYYGAVTLTFSHSNYWLINGIISRTDGNNQYRIAGGVILSGTLDRLRITMVNGTDSFDAGTINITYE